LRIGCLRCPACPRTGYTVGELSDSLEVPSINKLLLKVVMVVTVGSLLYSTPAGTQVSPTTNKAARVRITQGPEIERADPDFAIIGWTSNNLGGSREHYGIVRYGTNPMKLNQTANCR
jgi:hypothetical protein